MGEASKRGTFVERRAAALARAAEGAPPAFGAWDKFEMEEGPPVYLRSAPWEPTPRAAAPTPGMDRDLKNQAARKKQDPHRLLIYTMSHKLRRDTPTTRRLRQAIEKGRTDRLTVKERALVAKARALIAAGGSHHTRIARGQIAARARRLVRTTRKVQAYNRYPLPWRVLRAAGLAARLALAKQLGCSRRQLKIRARTRDKLPPPATNAAPEATITTSAESSGEE